MFARSLPIPVLLATVATPAAAQVHAYAGVGAGLSRAATELVANRESALTPATDIRTDFDADDRAWKAFAGARLNSVFALEAHYADLGSHRMVTRMLNAGLPAAITIDRKLSGYGVDLVAHAPVPWRRVGLFARAGMFRTRLEATAALEGHIEFSGTTLEERRFRRAKQHEDVFHLGAGVDWWIARNAGLRLEVERYHAVGVPFRIGGTGTTGEGDVDTVTLSVTMRF